MKISLKWLKELIQIDNFSAQEISEMLTAIGLEVEGMETVESLPGGLKGLLIGEVIECDKHPNADKLSLTRVNVGTGELLQIVCGAPNVAAGQKVVVATVGTELYPSEGDSFTIKKGKIRGEVSEGMICAADEIGLGDDHSGIIVLPADTPVGIAAADYYQIETDTIFEIGLTPNRSDATCHLGVAKDLAAWLKVHHKLAKPVSIPDLSNFHADSTDNHIRVSVENQEACPRYSGLLIDSLHIKESPAWLQNRLRAIGVRPINNVVDITNLVLHESGQPLHAFDADKISENEIIVKTLPEGTVFKSLDGVERKLHAEDLMICDGQGKPMCMGGVFGGIDSGVTDSTTSIFLESAHFNAGFIRRSSMRHNLRTDAAKVFEKGSDPRITIDALKRAALLMKDLAGAKIVSSIIDLYPVSIKPAEVSVRYRRLNELIGVSLEKDQVALILQALDMEIIDKSDTQITVRVPANKADVQREVDVIEEVLRIYGLNQVEMPDYIHSNLSYSKNPDNHQLKSIVGDLLSANGFFEMMNLSLSQSGYYDKNLTHLKEQLIYIHNTSNVHLDIMRPDMLLSGLEVVQHNQNRRQEDLSLFEFGKTYRKQASKEIVESSRLSMFLTGKKQAENWLATTTANVTFFSLKSYVEMIFSRLGISGFQQSEMEQEPNFLYGLKYHRGNKTLAQFGKVHPTIQRNMDIKEEVFYADLFWEEILSSLPTSRPTYSELSKYPTIRRDISLVADHSLKFGDIEKIVRKTGKSLIRSCKLFDVYENEQVIGKNKKSYAVSITFEDPSKTLKDKEIDKLMDKIISQCTQSLGATLRQ